MAHFISYRCRPSANEHQACSDGVAIYSCACWCHKTGERVLRYCDRCEVKPASRKAHPNGIRLCTTCEQTHVVDRGVIVPKALVYG